MQYRIRHLLGVMLLLALVLPIATNVVTSFEDSNAKYAEANHYAFWSPWSLDYDVFGVKWPYDQWHTLKYYMEKGNSDGWVVVHWIAGALVWLVCHVSVIVLLGWMFYRPPANRSVDTTTNRPVANEGR